MCNCSRSSLVKGGRGRWALPRACSANSPMVNRNGCAASPGSGSGSSPSNSGASPARGS
ncbi:hypothetical protein FW756_09430 [Leucobacter sp. 1207-22]